MKQSGEYDPFIGGDIPIDNTKSPENAEDITEEPNVRFSRYV